MEHFTTCPQCGQPMPSGRSPEGLPVAPNRRAADETVLATVADCQQEQPASRLMRAAQPMLAEPPAPPIPYLTDHAKNRYAERAWGVDMDQAEREILTPTVISAIKAGASAVTLKNGLRIKIIDGRIVTVMDRDKPKKMAPPRGEPKPEVDELREFFREFAEGALP